MPATTTPKGYPYPVGTDRVMDGDNAIQALAEAVAADAGLYTRAPFATTTVGAGTSVDVQWGAASVNGCALTKTSATVWTVTKAGLYVISATANFAAFSTPGARAFVQLVAGADNARMTYSGENFGTITAAVSLDVADTIKVTVQNNVATTVNGGWFTCTRLGRAN